MPARMRREPPRAHLRKRQHESLHRCLGGGDLGICHLREVLALQHFAVGDGHARIELDLALFFELVVEAGEQCFMHARRAGFGRSWRIRRLRQQHRHQLIDIAAATEENAEGLIENERMLVPLHEHCVQRPVKILARADARGFHRFERIEHRTGPDRKSSRAQRAGEVDNVFGEPAVALSHSRSQPFVPPTRLPSLEATTSLSPPQREGWIPACAYKQSGYSAALSSDFTSSSSSLTLLPSSRAMSSWYLSSTPSVSETVAGSSATTSSSDSAAAQSSVSATPGDLNRSCLRSACTNATTCSVSFLLTPGTLARTISSSRSAVG